MSLKKPSLCCLPREKLDDDDDDSDAALSPGERNDGLEDDAVVLCCAVEIATIQVCTIQINIAAIMNFLPSNNVPALVSEAALFMVAIMLYAQGSAECRAVIGGRRWCCSAM
mmetsp:Transcript_6108/g.10907  ORF Transcript_6108/g.10907 Transcript_6108/m.10907 type:complete len:112 (-) Transcript_6108:88-423(-)